MDIALFIKPHERLTDSIAFQERVLNVSASTALGLDLNMDSLWRGGCSPTEYVQKFGSRIVNVHRKDKPTGIEAIRRKVFGCGTATIPLAEGVIGIAEVLAKFKRIEL